MGKEEAKGVVERKMNGLAYLCLRSKRVQDLWNMKLERHCKQLIVFLRRGKLYRSLRKERGVGPLRKEKKAGGKRQKHQCSRSKELPILITNAIRKKNVRQILHHRRSSGIHQFQSPMITRLREAILLGMPTGGGQVS